MACIKSRVCILICILLVLTGCVQKDFGASRDNKRIVVTSVSTANIMEKLDVELVGIPDSKAFKIPKRYEGAVKVGSAMNPDIEIIRSLNPDYVFSPLSLVGDLKPRYDQANLNYGFLNLGSVEGMYKSIEDLGKILDREEEAKKLITEYENYINDFRDRNKDKPKKKILILMGLPGSYVVATNNSYVGNLVELAGGENVYIHDTKPFLNINMEDMLTKEPDIILRTAHALPDDVMKMFAEEFVKNNNWKHFKAVKENKVYDLSFEKFGMSASFNYPEALRDLEEILYE